MVQLMIFGEDPLARIALGGQAASDQRVDNFQGARTGDVEATTESGPVVNKA